MYATCLFCSAHLGTNEVIEPFPVGRRIAFDAAKGRLWVVCGRCERWNLAPLEERWEAIDACERSFRATRLRVSTDNVGLARVEEGLELVRIGAALRPEFAAWRYGDQFGRRRRRHLLLTGAGVTAGVGILIAGPIMGLLAGTSWALMNAANTVHNVMEGRRVRVRLRVPELAETLALRRRELQHAALESGANEEDWSIRIPLPFGDPHDPTQTSQSTKWSDDPLDRSITLSGRSALHAAGQLLPHLNAKGARRAVVQSAVRMIEEVGEPTRLFVECARRESSAGVVRQDGRVVSTINELPIQTRLALEMASHEETERRAMEGELALLAAAWRDAEEVAAIADQLLVPGEVAQRVAREKIGGDDPPA